MTQTVVLSLIALVSLALPGSFCLRRERARDTTFWCLMILALCGTCLWTWVQLAGHWQTGFSTAIWVTISFATMVFVVVAGVTNHGWRLTPLVFPYLLLMALIATIWQTASREARVVPIEGHPWILFHIVVSIATYSLATIAAMAALGAFLVERALKQKQPTRLSRLLPSVSDSEGLLVRLLVIGQVVLAIGITSGMGVSVMEEGVLMPVDHKSLFSLLAFIVIAVLLIAHFHTGVRGRRAARYVMVAYLMLTLGYPGVKFVTDVMMNG